MTLLVSQLSDGSSADDRYSTEPFLRWAGGKRWLAPLLAEIVPADICYVEPFLGGGSVFFGVSPDEAVLSDSNPRLMETYRVVRSNPEQVLDRLDEWPNDENNFYVIRSQQFSEPLDRAAQFIFLNRTCWNGLYRVNKQGQFNVPYGGRPHRPIVDPNAVRAAASALGGADLEHGDFGQHLIDTDSRHFVYLDPPYATKIDSGFLRYNPRKFSWADQRRLATLAREAALRGSQVVVSNAYCNEIIGLYQDFFPIPVSRPQLVAANAQHRSLTTEILLVSSQQLHDHLVRLSLTT